MQPEGITLRPLRDPEDIPFLREVYYSIRMDELAATGWPDERKLAFLAQQFEWQHAAYTTNYPGAQLDIIECGNVSVGRLYVHRGREEIRVMDIAVLPNWRNRGIGQALLGAVMAEGAALGKSVTIHVEKTNPAMRLYHRLCFAKIADANVYDLMEWVPPGMERRANPTDKHEHHLN